MVSELRQLSDKELTELETELLALLEKLGSRPIDFDATNNLRVDLQNLT